MKQREIETTNVFGNTSLSLKNTRKRDASTKNRGFLTNSRPKEHQLQISSPQQRVVDKRNNREDGIDKFCFDKEIKSAKDKLTAEKLRTDNISVRNGSQGELQSSRVARKNKFAHRSEQHFVDGVEEASEDKKKLDRLMEHNISHALQKNVQQEEDEYEEIIGSKVRKQVKKSECPDSNHKNIKPYNTQPEVIKNNLSKVNEWTEWIEQFSKKYKITPKELSNIFYFCSMNIETLKEYLAGKRYVLWTQEEDDLLIEGQKDVVQLLKDYKKVENVQLRLGIFEKFIV